MEKQRNEDIFNPSFSIKEFKITKKVVFIIFVFLSMFCYGASEFVYSNTIKIEIRTIKNKKINSISFFVNSTSEFYSDYQIINKSPYFIKLDIVYPQKNNIYFETNYNNSILKQNVIYYIWFKCINNSTKGYNLKINIGGIKI